MPLPCLVIRVVQVARYNTADYDKRYIWVGGAAKTEVRYIVRSIWLAENDSLKQKYCTVRIEPLLTLLHVYSSIWTELFIPRK